WRIQAVPVGRPGQSSNAVPNFAAGSTRCSADQATESAGETRLARGTAARLAPAPGRSRLGVTQNSQPQPTQLRRGRVVMRTSASVARARLNQALQILQD